MDMELTHTHVTYPLWLRVSFLGTLLFPFAAVYFARTRRDPIGMLLIPVAGRLVATWLGLLRLAQGMSLSGAGRRAASAGGAEAQLPLLFGLVVTALVAVVCAVRPPPAAPRRINLVVPPVMIVLLGSELWFSWYVTREGRTFAPELIGLARAGVVAALLLFVCSLILMARPVKASVSPPRASIAQAIARVDMPGRSLRSLALHAEPCCSRPRWLTRRSRSAITVA